MYTQHYSLIFTPITGLCSYSVDFVINSLPYPHHETASVSVDEKLLKGKSKHSCHVELRRGNLARGR